MWWIFIVALLVFAFVCGLAKKNYEKTKTSLKSDSNANAAVPKFDIYEDRAKEQKMLNAMFEMHSKERSIDFFVNGGNYRSSAAQEEYCSLCVGLDVQLKNEPENEHDEFAVKVMSSRKHIGYVSKKESQLVFQVVEQKCVSDCFVIDNAFAEENNIPKLMHVRLFIKPEFVDEWGLDGYEDPVGVSK